MKKSEIQARMTDYIEGDMSLSERALVDAHLDANPEMREEVDDLRRSVDLLRALPDEPGPMGLADQVMQRIHEGEGKPPLWIRARRLLAAGGSLGWAVPAVAATAVAAVAIVRGDLVVPGLSPLISNGEFAAGGPPKTTVVAKASEAPDARAASERLGSLVARRSADGQALIGASAAPERPVAENGQPVEAVDIAESTRIAATPSEAEELETAQLDATRVETNRQVAAATQRPSAPAVRVQPVSSATTGAPVTVDGPTGAAGPAGPAGADFVVQVAAESALPLDAADDSHRGEQQLDRRLDLLLRSPGQFMQELRGDSVAAQELWLGELAARAVERNIDERVVAALENSGDVEALGMAEFFAQAVEQSKSDTIASELPAP